MVMFNSCGRKLELEYPCLWVYKVIGEDYDGVRQAILEVIRDRKCDISSSRRSSSGKYHSLNAEITVESEGVRDGIYQALKEHPAVKIVL
jgi:putative lipoic acid-binding regulatory protein